MWDRICGPRVTTGTAFYTHTQGSRLPSLPPFPHDRDTDGLRLPHTRRAHWAHPPHRRVPTGPGRPGVHGQPCPRILSEAASSPSSQQQARPQPCCKVLTHTEHSLSPRTLLAPSSSCADILIVLLWELAGSLSSGMARRGARAGRWLWLLLREAAHSDRLSNNLNLLRRACGTPAGPLYLLH